MATARKRQQQYDNNGLNNTNQIVSESILDVIRESTINLEHNINNQVIKNALSDIIRIQAKKERNLRGATVMITTTKITDNNATSTTEIIEMIEREWIEGQKQPTATFWQDKEYIYCQFISKKDKNEFLDYVSTDDKLKFILKMVEKPNSIGDHFTRKLIRVSINNVRCNIKADRIKEILLRIVDNVEDISDFREGKIIKDAMKRTIMLKINAEGFRKLFGLLDGAIPYSNRETGTKTKLIMKINCRPWQCKECFMFGQHQCKGRRCGQCSSLDHASRDCKSLTKFCTNCNKKGHKSKDPHCSVYLNEIAKELRKYDIPMEYLEEKELRFALIKSIQIK